MDRKRLVLVLFTTIVGCTAAVPEVTSLTDLPSFSAKSTSPFLQKNLGDAIFLNGECLPFVTGFEFRLNQNILWTPIGSTPPSPDTDEYLVGSPEYDVDCSDGTFNFYLFKSTAIANFTTNGLVKGPGDPSRIEIRALGADLPSIIFERPAPAALAIRTDYYNFTGYVEQNQSQVFTVELIDAFGNRTMPASGQSKLISINLINMSSTSMPAGMIFDSTCTVPATSSDLTFAAGDDELTLCYMASVNPQDIIRIEATSSGLISNYVDIVALPIYTVTTFLISASPTGLLPPVLLKGVPYTFKMGINPIYPINRSISAYSGQFSVVSSSSTVSFKSDGADPDCPASWQSGNMSCSATDAQKTFTVQVEATHTSSYADFQVYTTPITSCASSCTVLEGGVTTLLSDYITMPTMTIEVASGSNVYDLPYINPQDPVIKISKCSSLDLGLANEDGTLIPGQASVSFTVDSKFGGVDFYSTYDCSDIPTNSKNFAFAATDTLKRIYYKVQSMPANGIIYWQVYDGSQYFTRPYYVEGNN